ncbi:trypsin-like peptidase domain-containing protein [Candidatus Uhrbacteria bacterium]|nr:trypsin-like peptidase domain-containing protein [Candidatus Uhrbacteria bacterium]
MHPLGPLRDVPRLPLAAVILGASLVGGLLGGAFGLVAAPSFRDPILAMTGLRASPPASAPLVAPPPVMTKDGGIAEDEQTIAVVERSLPAVVSIVVTKDLPAQPAYPDPFGDEFFEPFFEPFPFDGKQKIGGGSGFFVSADGLIVTNRHVVEDEDASYTVVTRDGAKLPATVVARDPVLDLAILDVEGEGYPSLTFAEAGDLKVGQTVIAIGNALDEFHNTVTKGVISGLNRRLTANALDESVVLEEAIQTDAAINPGNSGGPLIDLHGRVVGVSTAMSYAGQLIGFALPGDLAARDVAQVKRHGRITRAYLGIRYLPITEDLLVKNRLPVAYGVLIARGMDPADIAVIPGSPADLAGLKENDIVMELDGTRIDEEHTLSSLVGHYAPGDTAALRVYRSGETLDITVTFDEFTSPSS